jgi:GxxExxY protein
MTTEPPEHIDAIAHRVIGAAIEVHKVLGPGYLESVYEEALALEMGLRGIAYSRQHPTAVTYKDHIIGKGRLDFLVEDELVVDTKAVAALHPIPTSQVVAYLTVLAKPLGLLLNFNVQALRRGGI